MCRKTPVCLCGCTCMGGPAALRGRAAVCTLLVTPAWLCGRVPRGCVQECAAGSGREGQVGGGPLGPGCRAAAVEKGDGRRGVTCLMTCFIPSGDCSDLMSSVVRSRLLENWAGG